MESDPAVRPEGLSASNSMLKAAFIVGFATHIALWFLPAFTLRVGASFGMGGEVQTLSMFDVARLASERGLSGEVLKLAAIFAGNIVFLVLAVAVSRRWVFLAGATLECFYVIYDLFSVTPDGVMIDEKLAGLGWVAAGMIIISGFLIRPPIGPHLPRRE